MRDPYLYDDCDVLKNKLNIKDSAILDKAEVDISCNALHDISVSPRVTFICQYADSVGLRLDRELFERNSAYVRTALVAASAVFPDGDFRKPEYLRTIIKDGLERGAGAKRK
jgi:hypothetical protein